MPNTKNDYPGPINDSDKKTLQSAGVDVTNTPVEPEGEEDKAVSDTPEESVVDIDSNAKVMGEDDLQKTGIKFIKEENKEDLSALAERRSKAAVGSKDLEEEFRSELAVGEKSTSNQEIEVKSSSLSALLAKIQNKLGAKKKSVKEELGNLKKMKDAISKDINEIKDLEESEKKIEEEVGKIESIKKEVEMIEEEFGADLKN